MPINYSLAFVSNPAKPEEAKKAYARAQYNTKLTLKALCQRISLQSTLTRADVYAVIIAAVDNIVMALRDGNLVEMGELGKFRLRLLSTGAASPKEFTSNNITGVSVQFVPGEELKSFTDLKFELVTSRAMQRSMKAAARKITME